MNLSDITPGTRLYELATTNDGYRFRWQERFGLSDEQAQELWPWKDQRYDTFVTVPQPPPLDLKPTKPRAVVTVVIGDEAQACFAVSEPYLRSYAARLDADFVKLTWPGHPDWPMSSKFAIPRTLDHYERIAYLDSDTLPRPGCIDLFASCPAGQFGACTEIGDERRHFRRMLRYNQFRRLMGFAPSNASWYVNAGVYVAERRHRDYLLPPIQAIPAEHNAEQDWLNCRLESANVFQLNARCNWQWWLDPGFSNAPDDAILHFSGARRRPGRAGLMRRFAPDPLFSIDVRHREWIKSVLMTGQCRRVLEIGCYHGMSTRVFIEALQAGKVDEVHLCEPNVTPALERLIAGVPGVTLHRCRSVDLLARDARFDLVFVDGDHRTENCRAEARLLIAARVPVIFAHDTNCTQSPYAKDYKDCEGPQLFRAAFRRAGYRCVEDCEVRPGERTDRGMLLATLKPSLVNSCDVVKEH